jgi:hypothetical protein
VKTFPQPEVVEKVLAPAGDWLRFDAWSWLVATDYSVHDVNAALRSALTPEDSILIIRCDPSDYTGFAQPWVWNWLRKYQAPSAGLAGGYERGALASDSPLSAGLKPGDDR